jgi:C4-dicarboxylate transporter DctM subunit
VASCGATGRRRVVGIRISIGISTGTGVGTRHPARPASGAARGLAAKWELAAPLVAIGSIVAGMATPTESAALTAAYAVATQALAHRELGWRRGWAPAWPTRQLIGGVMLILGMALALTNFLVDAGIPTAPWTGCRARMPDRHLFLLALCLFLFAAAALMEIYAAIVVLVPLLLPLVRSYGIDPLHFGIIFLAAMEVGFLCPPAGMNLYFASAMFGKPIRYVAASVLPAVGAIFIGTVLIALWPGAGHRAAGLAGAVNGPAGQPASTAPPPCRSSHSTALMVMKDASVVPTMRAAQGACRPCFWARMG